MITFHALPTQTVARIRRDRTDSYGNPVEVHLLVEGNLSTTSERYCTTMTMSPPVD